jgi:hypothetical protein
MINEAQLHEEQNRQGQLKSQAEGNHELRRQMSNTREPSQVGCQFMAWASLKKNSKVCGRTTK